MAKAASEAAGPSLKAEDKALLKAIGCEAKGRKIECKAEFGSKLKINAGNFVTRGMKTTITNLRQLEFEKGS